MTRDEMREWLDRPPPSSQFVYGRTWRDWFDADGEYLGNSSGSVEPEAGADPPRGTVDGPDGSCPL